MLQRFVLLTEEHNTNNLDSKARLLRHVYDLLIHKHETAKRTQRCQIAKDNHPINVAPKKLYSTLQPNKIPETIAIPVYRCSYWLETLLLPISMMFK